MRGRHRASHKKIKEKEKRDADEMLSSSGRLMEIPFSASIEWIKQKPKQHGYLTLESALTPRRGRDHL